MVTFLWLICLMREDSVIHKCCFAIVFLTCTYVLCPLCMYKTCHKKKNKPTPKRQINDGSKSTAINMNGRCSHKIKKTSGLHFSSHFSWLWLALSTNYLLFVLLPIHFNSCSLIQSDLLLSNFKQSAGGLKLHQDIMHYAIL